MKKFFLKFLNYYLLLLFVLIFNEFTLVYFDKTPPLSEEAITSIRRIIFFVVIIFFYFKLIFLNNNLDFINRKISVFFRRISIFLFSFIIFDSTLKFFGLGLDKHWFEEDKIRFNTPYDMFSNKPNVLDHNNLGFRGPLLKKNVDKNTLTIAFLGGSTGYTGIPPIPELLSKHLYKEGLKNIVYNFSVNSSNHNQHIHRLVKYIDYPYDVIIFYGGNNESIQYLQYDTRPSFPYNYYIKNDLSIFKVFLLKYSSIFGIIENKTGLISGIYYSKDLIDRDFDNWSDKIVNNYISTIKNANLLFSKNIKTNKCDSTIFIPILQPVNPRTDKEIKLWNKMKKITLYENNFINYSEINNKINFYDNVHIDQFSRVKISEMMAKDIINIIDKKCN
tara:strand:+ start:124 stop:1293 length:1170 start_codon:yes stop_codon:yes gene_type:complete